MSYEQNAKWFESMYPYAKRAAAGTNIPVSVILAQWGLETGYGTSEVFKNANNIGGIKYVGQEAASGQYGAYASYANLDKYVEDYIRVMGLSFYKATRDAETPEGTILALHESPYAEDEAYDKKVLSVFNTYGLRGYDSWGGESSSGGSAAPASLEDVKSFVGGLGDGDLKTYAAIGAAVVFAIAFVKA